MKKVAVGMSGGVDSSVAAYLLKKEGYEVVGLFMHNWNEKDGDICPAEEDYRDVRRVCGVLNIPYYTVDYSREYEERVFKLFLEEYRNGRTPNPDVLCNKEIKFKELKGAAEKIGADFLATGHYCGVKNENGVQELLRAKDGNKCQTYFLNQVTQERLQNVLFPLYALEKPEVREIAKELGLSTAAKKDSTGICFIGERDFRKFLTGYLPMKKGEIRTLDNEIIGEHDGVFYYTIGQRKGFNLGGVKGHHNNEPWYIVKKDVKRNILYVNQGECADLFTNVIIAEKFNYISREIKQGEKLLLRTRHREKLIGATVAKADNAVIEIEAETPVRAVTEGQYAVLYDDEVCLGGGIITSSFNR